MFPVSTGVGVGERTGVGIEVDIGAEVTRTAPIVPAEGELSSTPMRTTLTRMFSEDGDVGTNSKTGQRGNLPRLDLASLYCRAIWPPPSYV